MKSTSGHIQSQESPWSRYQIKRFLEYFRSIRPLLAMYGSPPKQKNKACKYTSTTYTTGGAFFADCGITIFSQGMDTPATQVMNIFFCCDWYRCLHACFHTTSRESISCLKSRKINLHSGLMSSPPAVYP